VAVWKVRLREFADQDSPLLADQELRGADEDTDPRILAERDIEEVLRSGRMGGREAVEV
jgi:hypothetical protein